MVVYCRLSRDDENEGDSNSIANQKEMLEKRTRDNGYTDRKYKWGGYSETNFDRPGFQEMLADIAAGHGSTVIVKGMSGQRPEYFALLRLPSTRGRGSWRRRFAGNGNDRA